MMNVLKVARVKKDLDMKQLADLMNVTRQTISSWENKKTTPNVHEILQLHLKLDVPISDLVEFFSNKEEE